MNPDIKITNNRSVEQDVIIEVQVPSSGKQITSKQITVGSQTETDNVKEIMLSVSKEQALTVVVKTNQGIDETSVRGTKDGIDDDMMVLARLLPESEIQVDTVV